MEAGNTKGKKRFNRRAYLNQKLRGKFGSQQEGHGQAFLQKKAVVRQHFRLQKRMQAKERKKLDNLQNTHEDGSVETNQISPTDTTEDSSFSSFLRKNRPNNLRRAKAEFKKKIEEKQQRQEEAVRRKEEAEAAKKRYKEKRLHRFKKLCQKTSKGQPVMRGKIELMLESLQQAAHT